MASSTAADNLAEIGDDNNTLRMRRLQLEDLGEPVKIEKRECAICAEDSNLSEVATLSCGHHCCRNCLQQMFIAAIADETRHPPRCCEPIDIHTNGIMLFLTDDIVKRYEEKKIEWETQNRTYCSNIPCGLFIPSGNIIAGTATCPACLTTTCAFCKERTHQGDCAKDEALQQTIQLMGQKGWRRCFACGLAIELDIGCNHITCTCKAEFCYLCGLVWRTCACPYWDEDQILARAEVIAPRAGINFQEAVDLLGREYCQHPNNTREGGQGRCEVCRDFMMRYMWQCDTCMLRRCNTCTFGEGRRVHRPVA